MTERPYLIETAHALWPGLPAPSVRRGRTPAGVRQEFLAFPDSRSPSLLLPVDRAAAAGAVRAYGGRTSRLGRLRTRAAAGAFSLGLGSLLFRDRVGVGGTEEGISAELARVMGAPVHVAVRGGPPRANRKPVLAVLDDGGTPLAFAKVGMTPLTAALVQAEGEALQRLAGLRGTTVSVPRLLHSGPWRGMALLVQEALPIGHPRPVPDGPLLRAMLEIARAGGTTTASWAGSGHAERVRERLARTPASAATERLARAVDALEEVALPLTLGYWHGDWTPWNCRSSGDAVLVWDWERFGADVPLGMDTLHYDLQTTLARGRPAPEQPRALVAAAATRLAPLGLTPRQARVTAVAYLVEIAVRYLADDQAGAGALAGAVESWLLPVIDEMAPTLASERGVNDR